MTTAAVVSFRLGGGDGVSVEAAKWSRALEDLGFEVTTVAGDGVADRIVPGLAMRAAAPPLRAEVREALGDADVVIVENLCSLPLNPPAAAALADALAGRPAILHHHDLPWQRAQFANWPPPPDDPAWQHVTVNERSRRELSAHRIRATTIYNAFDPDPPPGRREEARAALGIGPEDRLVLQPTRAIARKRVHAAIRVTERLGGVYWLLGPPEDGYGPDLERLLGAARCPVRRGYAPLAQESLNVEDAYAACDVVALPSSWEGFGNPAVESATHRRPLVIGPYPVANELKSFGFEWFTESVSDLSRLARWLQAQDTGLLARNAAIARRWFSIAELPERLAPVLAAAGVPAPRAAPRACPSRR